MEDSLEGLAEFTKAVLLTVMVYYSERIQVRTSLVVKTSGFHCRGRRFNSWFGKLRPHMVRPKKKKRIQINSGCLWAESLKALIGRETDFS